jgi:hypothetical protein
MSDPIEDEKTEKISNITDLIFISLAAVAYMFHVQYPALSNFLATFIGATFIVFCLPHFYMMWREKTVLNYHFLKYILTTYEHRVSFVLRNTIVYFIYYYIWSFNQNDAYFIGLSTVVAFDLIILANIISSRRIEKLKVRFAAMPPPVTTEKE